MKLNAKWTVYLQPSWTYDVTVTMGSQADSTYNLKVTSGSSTYTLARSFFSSFFLILVNILINFFFLLLSFWKKKQQSCPWCQSIC